MRQFCLILFLTYSLFPQPSRGSEQKFTIVTDTWPPYVIAENNKIIGTDVDITRAVFNYLDMPIEIKIVPWKRCLKMMQQKTADGILGVSLNEARKEFLYYPETPVSKGTTVLFSHSKRPLSFQNISELNNKRTGAILGYSYCEELDNAHFIKNAERVSNLEQNFKKLMANRLDLVVEVDSVGLYTASKMGLTDKISIATGAKFCDGGNFLGFSKKAGHQELADTFNEALIKFKETEEFRSILHNYGL